MQSSCQDMRFSWFNGSAKENVEIPYWIQSGCNTTATQVWVKIPFIPAGDNASVFMYYNNSQASSKSSISGVMDSEIGSTTVGDAFTTVDLLGTYKSPVVVTIQRESTNSLPVSVMVRNVTQSSFEVALENPSTSAVSSETVYYLHRRHQDRGPFPGRDPYDRQEQRRQHVGYNHIRPFFSERTRCLEPGDDRWGYQMGDRPHLHGNRNGREHRNGGRRGFLRPRRRGDGLDCSRERDNRDDKRNKIRDRDVR